MGLMEAEHPRPRHFLLHLSDPHLLGGSRTAAAGKVDSDALLQQLFDEVRASGARPEAVIFTGDLADRGEPEAYAKLRAIVEPACKALGAKVIWAMGNHDNHANFRTSEPPRPARRRRPRGPYVFHQRAADHHSRHLGPGFPPR